MFDTRVVTFLTNPLILAFYISWSPVMAPPRAVLLSSPPPSPCELKAQPSIFETATVQSLEDNLVSGGTFRNPHFFFKNVLNNFSNRLPPRIPRRLAPNRASSYVFPFPFFFQACALPGPSLSGSVSSLCHHLPPFYIFLLFRENLNSRVCSLLYRVDFPIDE